MDRLLLLIHNISVRNKNQYMTRYLLRHMQHGLHDEILLRMQASGHARKVTKSIFFLSIFTSQNTHTYVHACSHLHKHTHTHTMYIEQHLQCKYYNNAQIMNRYGSFTGLLTGPDKRFCILCIHVWFLFMLDLFKVSN